MVAAGAAALMAASESGSSKTNDGVTSQCEPQNPQRISDNQAKRNAKVEKRSSFRNSVSAKTAPIRETKASRLRAASIVSPTEPTARKSVGAENSSLGLHTAASSVRKVKSPMSSTSRVPSCVTRERDKTAKRTSAPIKSPEAEEKRSELTSYYDKCERTRIRRANTAKQSTSTRNERSSNDCHDNPGLSRRPETQQQSTSLSTTSRASSAIASSSGMKLRSSTQRTSNAIGGHENSEVLRRVDALTALTRATMERVERLTSSSSGGVNGKAARGTDQASGRIESSSSSATTKNTTRKSSRLVESQIHQNSRVPVSSLTTNVNCKNGSNGEEEEEEEEENRTEAGASGRQTIRQPPISILKHKITENADVPAASSGNSVHKQLSLQANNSGESSLIEQLKKRHGILKKRSSLDDNEILRRRRSCSPDAVSPEVDGAEFKPILKHERRSSLDELVQRPGSPEPHQNHQNPHQHHHQQQPQHPPSILKRKSLGEEEREDSHQSSASEPTSILKRSSGLSSGSSKNTGIGHHVSIAAAVAKTLGCFSPEVASSQNSEVRPILKKKFSREESSSSDPPSLEPRPILKKKSSTDSDEHDEKPKTILKSSRKSSQDDSGNEIESASPKKLSMLKNRSIQRRTNSLPECDVVRPILKQSSSRESSSPSRSSLSGNATDSFNFVTKDLFLRKRARSLGHMQSNSNQDWLQQTQSHPRRDRTSFSHILIDPDRNPSLNSASSRPNQSDNVATVSIADTTAANDTTISTATSSIVSFKLPDRYERDEEDGNLNGDDASCKSFRYKFGKRSSSNEDEEEEAETVRSTSRENCNRRRDKWSARSASSDSSFGQNGRFASLKVKEKSSVGCGSGEEASEEEEKSILVNSGTENGSKVSRLAQRFKILEELTRLKENRVDRKCEKNARETKDQQRTDRFNTQPVTYEEVREAVLQNQRKAASKDFDSANNSSEDCGARGSDVEPSKLSLAERVRLFNRRIATESIAKVSGSTCRRRPANRYKTQPVTSEEVEVASRIFPSEKLQPSAKIDNEWDSEEDSNRDDNSTTSSTKSSSNAAAPPRSILKYSTSSLTAIENRSLQPRDSRKETEPAAGIIDEAYLLSAEHKFARKEFTARRLQRRKRVGQLESAPQQTETLLDADSGHDFPSRSNSPGLRAPHNHPVPSSYDNLVPRDNTDNIEINYDFDTADYVHTTNTNLAIKQRPNNLDKTHLDSSPDNISSGRRDKSSADMQQVHFPGISIADRLAALQRSGTTDWKRRVNTETVMVSTNLLKFASNNNVKETTTTTTTTTTTAVASQAEKEEFATKQRKLAERLEKLESAAEGWRKRVAVPDAVKFSVAGKMRVEQIENSEQLSPLIEVATNGAQDGKKKIPRPERFKSCKIAKGASNGANNGGARASAIRESSSGSVSEESDDETKSTRQTATILSVPRADDETFTSFFSNVSFAKCEAETLDFEESDFDFVTSFAERLGTRRTVQPQRRRLPSKNPLRTLAARTDLKDEYTEVTTGVAERVMRSLNVEKLAKNSSLAVEALAGLASTEDFGALTLKNVDVEATGYGNKLPPHKDVMLILVKGRRHVQIRLVEPVVASINSGDNFILVTRNELYNYVGKYSNVIEKARGAEIALSIQQNRDLGCRANNVITISEEKPTCTSSQAANFWRLLGSETCHRVEVIDAGHPDEDELYESALLDTNMVYEVVDEDELLPLDKYWGAMPKIEMLDPSKILVFDFGSEMYIWNGKIAPSEKRKVATQLAEELWQEGYDYSECTVSPINAASIIGRRTKLEENVKKSSSRPDWCLLGKLTQHMETVLFREKFLDWPNVSGIIRLKDKPEEKEQVDGKIVIEPPDVDVMVDSKRPVVDLILEGSHLGRGKGWYDDELMRQFVVETTNVTVWHIDEFSYSLLSDSSIGQFYTGDSYIVRWMYTVTITGRGLSGEPSKHASKGRDRCAYFIWQGRKASLNEQGTAALLTVELDQEQGPQVRVPEGFEPAAFLNLFSGSMVVHNGKKTNKHVKKKWRMYICRGNEESETFLTEVPCSTRQLRSRGSLLLINTINGNLYVWHGRAALPRLKNNALKAANLLKENRPEEIGLNDRMEVTIYEINESDEEPAAFFEALGGMNKQLYVPLAEKPELKHTPRLFNLSSVSGEFAATELLCPHRSEIVTPFPFLQDELYQVNQPALFLLDNKDELWLWQGWWPDNGSEDQTGSGAVRWQAERRAAMIAAMRYWEKLHPESEDCPVYLVWAGLEPLNFTNLFPTWTYRDEIAELNIRDGRDSGEVLRVEGELARLTQSTYPIAQLLQRPLPDGVDPTILEKYLSPQHFEELLGMNIEEFERLPAWKQINVKKKIGLF